ncbi:MAG: NAD(P)/FAD-dependent oxidoreductase [Actinomycetes bacterium]
MAAEFLVVGGGVSGLACARSLVDAGRTVLVRERDSLGGRARTADVRGRPVDVGAGYFTVNVPAFREVVESWVELGLARTWTDTFHVATPDGLMGTRTGPMRYIAPDGMTRIVGRLSAGLDIALQSEVQRVDAGARVDQVSYAAVAVSAPGPQAMSLLAEELHEERAAADGPWDPCLVVVVEFESRSWPELDAVFVNDSVVLTFVVDDGMRRDDDFPQLVAYVSPVFSAAHRADPERVVDPVLKELRSVLGVSASPTNVEVFMWPHAKPRRPASQPFFLGNQRVGLCGDGWHSPSRLESAYLSGRALGLALAQVSD